MRFYNTAYLVALTWLHSLESIAFKWSIVILLTLTDGPDLTLRFCCLLAMFLLLQIRLGLSQTWTSVWRVQNRLIHNFLDQQCLPPK